MSALEESARARLLAAADELFYAEGIHTVGIDRILDRAGVAKATLYGVFGSKDELIRAYLELRSASRRERIEKRLERYEDPRDRILAVFEVLAERAAEPSYRGCAFVNASAEGPQDGGKVRAVCTDHRAWLRGLFAALARELGLADAVARRLVLLYDGAVVAASMDRNPAAITDARAMVETLLNAYAEPTPTGADRRRRRGPPPSAPALRTPRAAR
jgi:AcrR family transcriptional regulator